MVEIRVRTVFGTKHPKRLSELLDAPVGKWQRPALNDDVDCYNRILRDAARTSSADLIDLNAFVCPNRKCIVMSREAPVRPDGLHFDGLGAEDTARWVLAQLGKL